MTDMDHILSLKENESYIVPESDYGHAEIWFKNGSYFLFQIPIYGGQHTFYKNYPVHRIDDMIKDYESWT